MNIIVGAFGIHKIINSISMLTGNIFSVINLLKITYSSSSSVHVDINKFLIKSDIETNIKLINSVISEIPTYYNDSVSVVLALNDIHDTIVAIEKELLDLHMKIVYNNSLYVMKTTRGYDLGISIEDLEIKFIVLDKRKDSLFKILELFKKTT